MKQKTFEKYRYFEDITFYKKRFYDYGYILCLYMKIRRSPQYFETRSSIYYV